MTHVVEFWNAGRAAEYQPDPDYPEGRDIDCSMRADLVCTVQFDHPAPGFGAWKVNCQRCGAIVAVGTAGQADDPRSLKIACAKREPQKSLL